MDHQLKLEIGAPKKGSVKVPVSVLDDDKTIHTDRIDPALAADRTRFIENVREKSKGLSEEQVSRLEADLMACSSPAFQPQASMPPELPDPVAVRDQLLPELDKRNEQRLSRMPPAVVSEARQLLREPRLIERLIATAGDLGLIGEEDLFLTLYLVGTSRLLPEPLAAVVQGLSSSGKSFVLNLAADLFPPGSVLKATDITPQAIYYGPPGHLIHVFVVGGEQPRGIGDDQGSERTRALREMISEGAISKLVPPRDDGVGQSGYVFQPGPIAYADTTTNTSLHPEDANRRLLLAADGSKEQTKRLNHGSMRSVSARQREHLKQVMHALQLLLRRVEVRIPFEHEIGSRLPDHPPEIRRVKNQLLNLIRAIALLHQYQRCESPQHGTVIEARIEDYHVARRLLVAPMGLALGTGLSTATIRFGRELWGAFNDKKFSTTDATRKKLSVGSKQQILHHLNALTDAGLCELVSRGLSQSPSSWRMLSDPEEPRADWLPKIEDIQADLAGTQHPTHGTDESCASGSPAERDPGMPEDSLDEDSRQERLP